MRKKTILRPFIAMAGCSLLALAGGTSGCSSALDEAPTPKRDRDTTTTGGTPTTSTGAGGATTTGEHDDRNHHDRNGRFDRR